MGKVKVDGQQYQEEDAGQYDHYRIKFGANWYP